MTGQSNNIPQSQKKGVRPQRRAALWASQLDEESASRRKTIALLKLITVILTFFLPLLRLGCEALSISTASLAVITAFLEAMSHLAAP